MLKRPIAAVAILTFALAFLPAGIAWCSADPLPCCAGKMCPMVHHHAAAKHSDCGMAGMTTAPANSDTTLCSCSTNRESRFVAALVFVLATPPTQISQDLLSAAPVSASPSAVDSFSELSPPPPKSL